MIVYWPNIPAPRFTSLKRLNHLFHAGIKIELDTHALNLSDRPGISWNIFAIIKLQEHCSTFSLGEEICMTFFSLNRTIGES